MPARRLLSAFILAALFASSIFQSVHAQLPAARLGAIFPAGGQPGKTVEVTLFGADLDDVDRLMFSLPGISAKRKMAELGPFDKAPQPVPNQFLVTVAANVPIGVCEVRAVGKYGASNPRRFAISDVAETLETEPNNDRETATELTLPVVVNGQSNQTTDVDFFQFTAPAGQRLLALSLARNTDSRMDSVITVYDASGRVLGSSGSSHGYDALVDFRTPAAGKYFVKIHDASFQGGNDFVYRLVIGAIPHIDFVFPPAGQPGGARAFTLYGRNLPGGKPSGLSLNGHALDSLKLNIAIPSAAAAQNASIGSRRDPANAGVDAIDYRVKGPLAWSQPTQVGIARAAPVLETANNNAPQDAQPLNLPCEVMGRFYPQRDRDWFKFDAKQGQSISIEVISHRMGLPTNPSLLVQRVTPPQGEQEEKVQQLAYVYESASLVGGPEFDIRHHDAAYRFTAPSDGSYRIMVRDAYGDVGSDPRRTYRLVVRNEIGDFRLAAVAEQSSSGVFLRKGGQAGIRVVAFRRDGFDGEIRVTATGLPAGVTCTDAILGPSSDVGMILLSAAANAAPATAMVQVTGKAKVAGVDVNRKAQFGAALSPTAARQNPNQNMPAVDSRLTNDLCVSVSAAENALISLKAGGGKVWETSRAGKLKIPVTRGGAFKGQISFRGRGLPGVNFPIVNLAANKTTGEVQVNLTDTIPPGEYSFYLDGIAQQVTYNRNPEAAAQAAARKKEVDAIKVKVDADLKVAVAAKAAADKQAASSAAVLGTATTARATAAKALQDAMTAVRTTAAAASKAAAAVAANPKDANLANVAKAAKKAADDATAQAKTSTTNLAAAEKALVDATQKAKTAADAKTKADEASAAATLLAQQAAQLKTKTDQQATALANAAKPKKLNVPVVSSPVTIKIAPAPVTMTALKPLTVKQGEKIEAAIAIQRLFQYEGAVAFSAVLAPGVSGLSIPNAQVAAKQTQGKLIITAAANATEGQHDLKVRGRLNLNGRNLTIEQPLRLVVQKVVASK